MGIKPSRWACFLAALRRVGRLPPSRGSCARRFFIRLATLHLTKNALALHLLLEHAESLIDVVVANEYLQNVSNRVAGAPMRAVQDGDAAVNVF